MPPSSRGRNSASVGQPRLNETLLQKHLGQVAGHEMIALDTMSFAARRAGAQNMQTVLHELDELTGQVVQGLPGPVGLRRRDDGSFIIDRRGWRRLEQALSR